MSGQEQAIGVCAYLRKILGMERHLMNQSDMLPGAICLASEGREQPRRFFRYADNRGVEPVDDNISDEEFAIGALIRLAGRSSKESVRAVLLLRDLGKKEVANDALRRLAVDGDDDAALAAIEVLLQKP